MNTTLIMNASEGRIQFVLEQEGSLACAQEWSAPSKGTELLTPALADAFQRLGIMPSDISRIACVAGPGSFTGLRLALTTAAAFRRATGAAVAPLNALQVLAASVLYFLPPRNAHPRDHTRPTRPCARTGFSVRPRFRPAFPRGPAMWEIPGGLRRRAPRHHARQRHSPQSASASGTLRRFRAPLSARRRHPTAQALLDQTLSLPDGAWGH